MGAREIELKLKSHMFLPRFVIRKSDRGREIGITSFVVDRVVSYALKQSHILCILILIYVEHSNVSRQNTWFFKCENLFLYYIALLN